MKRNKVLIIAEAGVNHNGDLNKAFDLIDIAANSGADFVKFQTYVSKNLVTEQAKKADYQIDNLSKDDSQYKMLKKLEIPKKWYPELLKRCEEKKIKFLSTAFDLESIDFLNSIGLSHFKIPSGEITHRFYLEKIAKLNKPVFLSTGLSTYDEVEEAVNVLFNGGLEPKHLTILHCTTAYPTPYDEVNLSAIVTLKKKLGLKVGYSDHTQGTIVSVGAVAIGAEVIEKHFTLDKTLPGPDHKCSLDPSELIRLVKEIKIISEAFSMDGKKKPTETELKNKIHVRKSLFYSRDISEGEIISEKDLIALRPAVGISPMKSNIFIGKKLIKKVFNFQLVKFTDVK